MTSTGLPVTHYTHHQCVVTGEKLYLQFLVNYMDVIFLNNISDLKKDALHNTRTHHGLHGIANNVPGDTVTAFCIFDIKP